jgi:hypothetical protein
MAAVDVCIQLHNYIEMSLVAAAWQRRLLQKPSELEIFWTDSAIPLPSSNCWVKLI